MTNNWQVTNTRRYDNKIELILTDRTDRLNPVKFTYLASGAKSYEWDGWELSIDVKYRDEIDAAVLAHLSK